MAERHSLISDYDSAFSAVKKAIQADGLVVYPTDTLYGIGCNALSEKATARIYVAKIRDKGKPLSIIVSDFEMLSRFCKISAAQKKILLELLPGPYTFILPLKKPMPASQTMEIGVRVPEHAFMRQASKELGLPIVSTSANLSGKPDAANLSSIDPSVAAAADVIIDGGDCGYAQGSTVIDLIRMKVLRKGAVRKGDRIEWAD
ncbi:MAG: L-threonylcarbamoyladenylate synthase [Candidatus Micrarchaeia archaeon]